MEQEIKCSVCNQIQIYPTILPCCYSSVCFSHIGNSCPLCNISISQSETTHNWILLALEETSDPLNCERCTTRPAKTSCETCKILLCSECYSYIHSLGAYKSHSQAPIKLSKITNFNYCEFHKENLAYFCTEDWKSICKYCLSMHSSHPILKIEDAFSETLHEIKSKQNKLEKLRKKLIFELNDIEVLEPDIEYAKNEAINKIKEAFKIAKRAIELKEEECIDEINNFNEKKIQQLNFNREEINGKLLSINAAVKLIETAVELPKSAMLESLKYLSKMIDHSLSVSESHMSSVDAQFQSIDISAILKGINSGNFFEINNSPAQDRYSSFPSPQPSLNNTQSPLNSISNYRRSNISSPNPFSYVGNNTNTDLTNSDPSEPRKFILKQQTSSEIKLSWTYTSGKSIYSLEYGVGSKVRGVEQFRQVYKGEAHTCIITDLLPKTTYRFRVAAISEEDTKQSPWSEITSVSTFDLQDIDENICKNLAIINKRGDEKWVQFERAGIILAQYPYYFGKHIWKIKVISNAIFSTDEKSGQLKIGVSSPKHKNIVGCLYSYGLGKGISKLCVVLDIEAGTLKIISGENQEGESFTIEGPQIPAIQYRPARNSRNNVKVMIKFDEKDDNIY
ncbi:unnamed protein product [Blepharisma stoltei]|uniref:Uncharacterized protein n=1 Tax=Blepharisma stoltei TaxID=1481888 RepID=A0AAU9K7D8_9CILI|nr:unnamed protein product [Blepharisma stoltei]